MDKLEVVNQMTFFVRVTDSRPSQGNPDEMEYHIQVGRQIEKGTVQMVAQGWQAPGSTLKIEIATALPEPSHQSAFSRN
jgi:hypothetical protein